MTEALGAKVGWDGTTRSVSLDFVSDPSETLFRTSRKGFYQYISIQNRLILNGLIDRLQHDDTDGMKEWLSRYADLRRVAPGLGNQEMADVLDKLFAAGEWMRSGWAAKNTDNYNLAWTIFKSNAQKLNDLLQKELSDDSAKPAATGGAKP